MRGIQNVCKNKVQGEVIVQDPLGVCVCVCKLQKRKKKYTKCERFMDVAFDRGLSIINNIGCLLGLCYLNKDFHLVFDKE